ncbi:MAG TPA: response regulator transcription factor [Mycobacteriales bacterium]
MNDRRRVWSTKSGDLVLEELTDREIEVLENVAAGYRNREIAERLNVTPKTVEYHLTNILAKLGVRSRTEAVVRAWQLGRLGLRAIS